MNKVNFRLIVCCVPRDGGGVFAMEGSSHLFVRLSDCAHELGPSLCDAFIAHFEVVQVVF